MQLHAQLEIQLHTVLMEKQGIKIISGRIQTYAQIITADKNDLYEMVCVLLGANFITFEY